MAKDKKKDKKQERKASGPIAPKIFKGLQEGRMKSGGGNFADRCEWKQGDTITVQFLEPITDFAEYDQHQFRDGGKWKYVPCGGENCPLCADDDADVSKVHYRFSANVYNHGTKRVEVLEGPKTVSNLVAKRYKKAMTKAKGKSEDKALKIWQNLVWDMSKMKTQPVSFDMEEGDDDPVSENKWKDKLHDLGKNIIQQFTFYFGDSVDISALEAKEDEDAASSLDDKVAKKDLKGMDDDALKKLGKSFGVKLKGKTRKEFIDAILEAQE